MRPREATRLQIQSEAQKQLLDRGIGPVVLGAAVNVSKQAASLWLRGLSQPGVEMREAIEHAYAVPSGAWELPPGSSAGTLDPCAGEALYVVRVVMLAPQQQTDLLAELLDDGVDAAADGQSMIVAAVGSAHERDAICSALAAAGFTYTTPGRRSPRRR